MQRADQAAGTLLNRAGGAQRPSAGTREAGGRQGASPSTRERCITFLHCQELLKIIVNQAPSIRQLFINNPDKLQRCIPLIAVEAGLPEVVCGFSGGGGSRGVV
jgi:hypothetical protein